MLNGMKDLSIDFLSTLDYVDLQNLCKSDKKLSNICVNDSILRNILYQTYDEALKNSNYMGFYMKNDIALPKIYLPPNFPIARALRKLYNNIDALVDVNYPADATYFKWPRWVDKAKFKDDMIRQIYNDLCYKIRDYLYDKKPISDAIKSLDSVNIQPSLLAFPFVYDSDEQYLREMEDDDNKYADHVTNTLKIPDLFRDYLYEIFNAWNKPFDEYTGILEDTLWAMLFYRDYSRNANRDY